MRKDRKADQSTRDEWQIIILEMDEAGKELRRYFAKQGKNLKRARLSNELCDRDDLAKKIGRIVVPERKTLAIYGSGRFHHYTYGLCRAADRFSDSYGYIHFDHHDDYNADNPQRLGCSSFVNAILEDSNAQSVFFVGLSIHNSCTSFDKSGKSCKADSLEEALEKIPEEVYLSFDLDVMDPGEIVTDYDQGKMKAEELLQHIKMIKGEKRIISADILGYASNRSYSIALCKKSKQLYAQIAAAILCTA